MLTFDENLLISYTHEIKKYCGQWTNGIIANQYLIPCKLVAKYLTKMPRNPQVLDWGCGDGHFSFFLLNQGCFVSAYSFGELGDIAGYFEKKFKNRFQFTRSVDLEPVLIPYESNSLDAVFSIGVLEHVREFQGDELGSLKEMYRILKPEGKIFIFHLPNKISWIEAITRIGIKIGLFRKHFHLYRYTMKDLEMLANAAGLRIVENELYNLFPRNFSRKDPSGISNNIVLNKLFNSLEKLLSVIFKAFSQNHYVVLEKKL
ncbi:MAG: class I SAM-dependent methyltransferase [Chlamydiae bacterium]|nr:class I SAM-dependent methyltransferase [Chlamydiota bacterium]